MRRFAWILVPVVAVCAAGAAAATSPGLARFRDRVDKVSFRYPPQWRAQLTGNGDLDEVPIVVALSTQRLHKPCEPYGTGTHCGFQVMLPTLPTGGVFVTWTIDDTPFPSAYKFA